MRPTRVRDPLGAVLHRVDPEQRLRAYRVWTFWAEEMGEAIASRAQPVALRAGVLTVAVSSHAWIQELQFLREDIVRRLNARLGEPLISDLFLISGSLEAGKRSRRQRSNEDEAVSAQPVAIPTLSDPRLAAAFARLAQAQARRRR